MKFPEQYRFQPAHPMYRSGPGDPFGSFQVSPAAAPGKRPLNIIAVDGVETGWEHVSVSLSHNSITCPTWDEMCFVKSLFWSEEECVIQLHPPKADYINQHKGVLHLWKPVNQVIPMPPKICV